ncbi:deleted in malignant brain tumors 1 protein-like isoform X3 [Orbicella faveolata]|uniref:deleted in malignant brain tumors 1 protein-like isoform X3 n=1 Tax=Orbicella faveolata TaxID=48498 RepID=UPI0009E1C272|nr:deleted in malignant brain tumors 1 protein-like isoform X3 [Orbicella faveolata]
MFQLLLGIVILFHLVSTSTSDLDPCVSYKELRDSNRSQFHSISGLDLVQCDKKLVLDWYRFKGGAGLKMPDSCVKSGHCGTHSPGWFQGSHPTKVGDISIGRICFNFMGSCCQWYTATKVKKCSGFYVYQLPSTPYCDLQYCGDGATDLDCAADNNNVTINGSNPGSLSSPDFPRQYPNNLQCTWRIMAPAGMKVKLVLKNMTLGPNDYVMFRDGVRDDSPLIAKYAYCASGEIRLYSTDQYLLVNFVSDSSKPGNGFQLDYETVDSSKVRCSQDKDICSLSSDIKSLPGNIRSPGLPKSPSGNSGCRWNLDFPVGYKTLVEFSWFGMAGKGSQSHCVNDYVTLGMDGEEQSNTYCGCKLPSKRLYDREKVFVTFNNSQAANQAGFLLHYRAVAADECTDGVDSCEIKMNPVGMNKDGDVCYDDFDVDVKCDTNKINVVLHIKSPLHHDPESVHLNDVSCKPYFQNDSHIFIKSTLDACGMTWNLSADGEMIVYSNAITALVRTQKTLGLHATRDHQAVFEFQCRYKRKAVLSVVSFDPSKIFVVTDIEAFGNFTFEMNMFKSENFNEYYTEYPVGPIDIGTDIFLQVSVTSRDAGLVVFVDECKATPTSEYHDQMQFIFLEDGCAKDNALRFNYTLSPVQRLILSAFRFNAVKSKEIFLHCLVKACLRSDQSSPCAEGCPFSKRKKRESENEIERFLALGPIIVSSNQPSEITESLTPKESTAVIGVVAGLLGFVALLLLAALVAVIYKRRKKPDVTGAVTLPLVRDNVPGPD